MTDVAIKLLNPRWAWNAHIFGEDHAAEVERAGPPFTRAGRRYTWRRRATSPPRWGRCELCTRWSWAPEYERADALAMSAECFFEAARVPERVVPVEGAMARAFASQISAERRKAGVLGVFTVADMTMAMLPHQHRVPRV